MSCALEVSAGTGSAALAQVIQGGCGIYIPTVFKTWLGSPTLEAVIVLLFEQVVELSD